MNKTEVAKKLSSRSVKYAMTKDPNTAIVKQAFEKTKKSEKKEEKKEKKFDPVNFLKKNPETVIEFIQENPKKPGSKVHENYEKYKSATTFQEFLDSGGENNHIRHDFSKGFIKILDDSVENDDTYIKNKVYYNPALDVGATIKKTKRKSKRRTKRKTKRKTKKKSKKSTKQYKL